VTETITVSEIMTNTTMISGKSPDPSRYALFPEGEGQGEGCFLRFLFPLSPTLSPEAGEREQFIGHRVII
jgi:hypothetical protein